MNHVDDVELGRIEKRLQAALKAKQPFKLNHHTAVNLLSIVQEERVRRETGAREGKPAGGKKHELTLDETVGTEER